MSAIKRTLRRPLQRRLTAVGVIAAASLLLSACGSQDDNDSGSGTHHGGETSAAAEPGSDSSADAGDFNDTDVTFAQGMIPHHEQAIEMSRLVADRSSDPEIKKLAGQIEKAQDPEIKTLRGWLKSWGKPADSMSDHSGHSDMGMMSDKDMKELMAAKGTAFDKAFAEMMIAHHNGAISMAKDEQKNGKSADAKKMAAAIVKGQSAEVTQFEKILDRI